MPYDAELRYYFYGESGQKRYTCLAIDVSNSGLGIITETPLEFGQFLAFESLSGGFSPLNAVVQWSMPLAGKFRAGLFLF